MHSLVSWTRERFIALAILMSFAVVFATYNVIAGNPMAVVDSGLSFLGVGGFIGTPHKVGGKAFSANEVITYNIKNRHINGITIYSSINFASTDKISINLTGDGTDENIINNISLLNLCYISDNEGGFSQKGRDDADETAPTVISSLYIDLGSIWIYGSDNLEIVITCGSGAKTFNIYAVTHALDVDYMRKYTETTQTVVSLNEVERVYVTNTTSLLTADVTALITVSGKTFSTDMLGVVSNTMSRGQSDLAVYTTIAHLYSINDGLPDNLNVQLSGANAATATLISIQKQVISDRLSKYTLKAAGMMTTKITEIESMENGNLARGYRHAGWIPKSEELAKKMAEIGKA